MNTLALSFVIISAFLHALRNLFTKESGDKQVFLWWSSLFALLYFLLPFLYILSKGHILNLEFYLWCALSGFIHFLYWIFLTHSYKEGELSHVYPIMRSSPAIVLLFAILVLHEQVSAQGITGVLFVAVGIYVVNMKRLALSEFLQPFKKMARDRSTQFAFLTLFSVAAYNLVDKVAVGRVHPLLFAYAHLFFGMAYYTIYIAFTKTKNILIQEWTQNRRPILISGFIGLFGYSLILIAFTLERVSYVVGLRQMSVVFGVNPRG